MIGYNGFHGASGYTMQFQGVAEGHDSNAGSRATHCNPGNYGGNSYQQNQVLTASPEQILIMLFDAAIRFCREAQTANDEGNTALKLEKIGRVFNIITEFSNTLDHSIGGEIAGELEALYRFNLEELGRARKDSGNGHLQFVENFLLEWRETWTEVIGINRADRSRVDGRGDDREHGRRLAVAG